MEGPARGSNLDVIAPAEVAEVVEHAVGRARRMTDDDGVARSSGLDAVPPPPGIVNRLGYVLGAVHCGADLGDRSVDPDGSDGQSVWSADVFGGGNARRGRCRCRPDRGRLRHRLVTVGEGDAPDDRAGDHGEGDADAPSAFA